LTSELLDLVVVTMDLPAIANSRSKTEEAHLRSIERGRGVECGYKCGRGVSHGTGQRREVVRKTTEGETADEGEGGEKSEG
jgi:hypothetical protein